MVRPSSQDPSPFSYAAGNPVRHKDPWGLFVIDPSCDCPGGPGDKIGANIPQAIAKACRYLRSPGCTALLDKRPTMALGRGGGKRTTLRDCFERRCSPEENGKGPRIVCSLDKNQCGYTPLSGDIVLYQGDDTCPRIYQEQGKPLGPRDYSQTLFHEVGHTCGVPPDEPDWWREIQKVCTGWPL